MTRIVVSHLNNGWRAGQHVRVRIIGTGAGWRVIESHPLIIASNPGAEEGLILMCKVAASWTKRLYALADTQGGEESDSMVKIAVEGPYGKHLLNRKLQKFNLLTTRWSRIHRVY
jgi:NAD(P)H-flavin reductase